MNADDYIVTLSEVDRSAAAVDSAAYVLSSKTKPKQTENERASERGDRTTTARG